MEVKNTAVINNGVSIFTFEQTADTTTSVTYHTLTLKQKNGTPEESIINFKHKRDIDILKKFLNDNF